MVDAQLAEIGHLKTSLAEANTANAKLCEEINGLNERTSTMATELHSEIENLTEILATSEKNNSEALDRSIELQNELSALKEYTALLERVDAPNNGEKMDIETQTAAQTEVRTHF